MFIVGKLQERETPKTGQTFKTRVKKQTSDFEMKKFTMLSWQLLTLFSIKISDIWGILLQEKLSGSGNNGVTTTA